MTRRRLKFVITGSWDSGKTTLIQLLEDQGYVVVPEQAYIVFESKRFSIPRFDQLNMVEPNLVLLQEELYQLQRQAEKNVAEASPVFLDRGIFDVEAYSRYFSLPNQHWFAGLEGCYDLAFMLDPISIAGGSPARETIAMLIEGCYRQRGIPIQRIPLLSPEDRLRLVLEKVSSIF